ncbi:MAG: hypothetical protein IJX53_01915 [Clostridia bacterium]|nr:hypothetical protein [Clostridia bacterium]
MKKVFIVVGIGSVVLGIVAFFALLLEPLIAVCAAAGLILSGCLMVAVGDLLGRVDYLERQLGLYAPDASHSDLPQKTCPACGRKYDFDYPKCPHCGHEGADTGA